MSYQEKLDAALVHIREHNGVVGENNPGYVDENKFVQSLKVFGAHSEEDLHGLSWSQIIKILTPALVKDPSLPEPEGLAKKIATSWRSNSESKNTSGDKVISAHVSSKKAHKMSPRELIEAFDPEEPDSPVGNRLSSISKKHPFLIYSKGRIVDVDASLALLMEVKQGFPPRKTYEGKRVYNVGQLPESYAEENPLYPGRPLRPDGSCDQLNRSWAGVCTEIRQFVRVMIECGEFRISSREDGHYILDIITTEQDPLNLLKERYQEAAIQYEDRKNKNSLPNLLVSLTVNPAMEEPANPFDQGKRVQWFAPPNPAYNYYGNTADRSTLNEELAKMGPLHHYYVNSTTFKK
jgi:hypothetical protein